MKPFPWRHRRSADVTANLMAYRERTTDDRWTVPHLKVPERTLPKSCHLAFEVFDKQLEMGSHERPLYLESPHDDITEVFFPDYDQVAPSLAVSAGGCGCLSFLIVSATGAAGWAARSLFDEQVMGWAFGGSDSSESRSGSSGTGAHAARWCPGSRCGAWTSSRP